MGNQSARVPRLGAIRRIGPTVAAFVASAAVCAPAMASSPTIAVNGDSVLATNFPTGGNATIEATRPDALTGAPVVIGLFAGSISGMTPFSVNTTTPSALDPAGDCWQKGALSQALTPDLQAGDTVTIAQSGSAGTASTTDSVPVTSADTGNSLGPVSGCNGVAPWARNAVTSGPSTVTGGAITIAGIAQPLATQVSVSATDGTHSTTPVSATLASDDSWTATIPAADVTGLAGTRLMVTPVVAVPDVSTGAQAHIAGVGWGVTKPGSPSGAGPGKRAGTGGSRSQKPSRGLGRFLGHVQQLRAASTVTLARARRDGLRASFILPAGAKVVRVELLHGKTQVFTATAPARQGGTTQNVLLRSNRLSRLLRTGRYTIAVQVGTSASRLGPIATRPLRIQ
ncbi:MAG TPA: hypothetical protein VG365_03680 [Solirubrobacteraceae bacterium]|nr:hypothetical protein [Solirubrobacteraceae bacterium]